MDKLGPYLLGPNDENQGIYTGDTRELAKVIPDESVDLIFTDPVYQRIEDYAWLADVANRVLKPEGQALIYQAHKWLPETFMALSSLTFVWMLGERMIGQQARYWPLKMFIGWRPLLWYSLNGGRPFNRMGQDISERISTIGNNYKWHKRTGHVNYWLEQLSNNSSVVLDPFSGGGSIPAVCKMLARRWLAFEIDPDTADLARKRVQQTQPPLFVPQPEQMEFAV